MQLMHINIKMQNMNSCVDKFVRFITYPQRKQKNCVFAE